MENDTTYLWVIFGLLILINLDYVLEWILVLAMGAVLIGLALCFIPAIWAMPIPAAIMLFIWWVSEEEERKQHD